MKFIIIFTWITVHAMYLPERRTHTHTWTDSCGDLEPPLTFILESNGQVHLTGEILIGHAGYVFTTSCVDEGKLPVDFWPVNEVECDNLEIHPDGSFQSVSNPKSQGHRVLSARDCTFWT